MNSSKIWRNVVSLVAVLAVVGILVYVYVGQDKVEKALFALQNDYSNTRFELWDWKDDQRYRLKTEGEQLPDSLARQLPAGTCILRIHNSGCLACFAQNFTQLYAWVRQKQLPLFVLGTYRTQRIFKKELAGLIPLDSVPHVNVDNWGFLPADSIDKPYLFVKGAGGRVQQVYLFNKYEYETLGMYLDGVKKSLPQGK